MKSLFYSAILFFGVISSSYALTMKVSTFCGLPAEALYVIYLPSGTIPVQQTRHDEGFINDDKLKEGTSLTLKVRPKYCDKHFPHNPSHCLNQLVSQTTPAKNRGSFPIKCNR